MVDLLDGSATYCKCYLHSQVPYLSLSPKEKQENNIFLVHSAISLNGFITYIGAGQYHRLIHEATKCIRQDGHIRLE